MRIANKYIKFTLGVMHSIIEFLIDREISFTLVSTQFRAYHHFKALFQCLKWDMLKFRCFI